MRQFHHFGIPTDSARPEETYLDEAKVFITDPEKSPNSIEWLRFEADGAMPELLKSTPHIAYKVENLAEELKGREILLEPFRPLPGLAVAFVIEENAPIELMQFDNA